MQNDHPKLIQQLKQLGFSDSQIAALTYSSERTVQNWLHRRSLPSPLVVQQLARVIRIVEDLRKLINPVAFHDWFFQSNQFLGKSPYQAIIDGDYDKLQELTFSLLEGSFV
jgi:transcriptional regulator with XRE-family HTH domain